LQSTGERQNISRKGGREQTRAESETDSEGMGRVIESSTEGVRALQGKKAKSDNINHRPRSRHCISSLQHQATHRQWRKQDPSQRSRLEENQTTERQPQTEAQEKQNQFHTIWNQQPNFQSEAGQNAS